MTPTTPEPRFVNLAAHPVQVRDAAGHEHTVRPFRELAAYHWRKDVDCICVGQHYAKFQGLLAPFPEPEQPAAPPAQADPVGAGLGIGAAASTGTYKATGDVLRPDGTVKKDDQDTGASASAEAAGDSEPVDPEPVDEVGDAQAADEQEAGESDASDVDEDRPLEDVPGVTKALAAALRKAGYKTAVDLANCQTPVRLTKLGKVKGVKDADALAAAAQDLLGWEDVEDDEDS